MQQTVLVASLFPHQVVESVHSVSASLREPSILRPSALEEKVTSKSLKKVLLERIGPLRPATRARAS
eukprot:5819845-Amphidinium_carterae.1